MTVGIFFNTTFGDLLELFHPFPIRGDVEKAVQTPESVSSAELPSPTTTVKLAASDVPVVDWTDDDDPEKPINWTTTKKLRTTIMLMILTFSIYIGSSIYTPGTQQIATYFNVSPLVVTIGLTLYVFGYGAGPMFWAPVGELTKVGRNPVYVWTLLLFGLLQIPTALAPNIGTLLSMRLLGGFVASPALAIPGASFSEMYAPRHRAYAITFWGMSAVLGPVLGPIIGGYAFQTYDWRFPFWILMVLAGFAFVCLFFLLPETAGSNILTRRARRLRGQGHQVRSVGELASEGRSTAGQIRFSIKHTFVLTLTEPMVFAFNLYIALCYGVLYIWFESFVDVFINMYHFSVGSEGLAFLGILVGALITCLLFLLYLKYYLVKKFDATGALYPPELRLHAGMFGSFFIPLTLFMFGWTAKANIPWIVPIIATAFFPMGIFLAFQSALNYLADVYPMDAWAVFSSNAFFRSCFGAAFPLFANAMFGRLGVDWGSSLLGFISVAMIIIPFGLYWFGASVRRQSTRARTYPNEQKA